jgi:thioredoxin-like negative regulator of GroEL
MSDPAYSSRIRRAAIALAEVADTSAMFPTLERRPAFHAVMNARRDSVRALIARLKAAQQAKDTPRIDTALEELAAQWDAMHALALGSAITADGRRRIEAFVAMLMSDHGPH